MLFLKSKRSKGLKRKWFKIIWVEIKILSIFNQIDKKSLKICSALASQFFKSNKWKESIGSSALTDGINERCGSYEYANYLNNLVNQKKSGKGHYPKVNITLKPYSKNER